MTQSRHVSSPVAENFIATPYDFHLQAIPTYHFRAEAAASLMTTASDLALFLIANTQKNTVLSASTRSLMQAPVVPVAGKISVGLGYFSKRRGAFLATEAVIEAGSREYWQRLMAATALQF